MLHAETIGGGRKYKTKSRSSSRPVSLLTQRACGRVEIKSVPSRDTGVRPEEGSKRLKQAPATRHELRGSGRSPPPAPPRSSSSSLAMPRRAHAHRSSVSLHPAHFTFHLLTFRGSQKPQSPPTGERWEGKKKKKGTPP